MIEIQWIWGPELNLSALVFSPDYHLFCHSGSSVVVTRVGVVVRGAAVVMAGSDGGSGGRQGATPKKHISKNN